MSTIDTSQSGDAAAVRLLTVIFNRLALPGVFQYGELLEQVQNEIARDPTLAQDKQLSKWVRALKIIMYDDMKTYRREQGAGSVPILLGEQLEKLELMSFANTVARVAVVDFDTVRAATSRRTLLGIEQFLIEAIYSGAVQGQIDSENGLFHVESVAPRDVSPDRLAAIESIITDWRDATQKAIDASGEIVDETRETTQARTATVHKYRDSLAQAEQEQVSSRVDYAS